MLSSVIPATPPAQPDDVDLPRRVQEAIYDIIHMNWRVMGFNTMIQAFQSCFFVDQMQVNWILQGYPQYAFAPAGSNDEIEISLVPRDERVVAQEEVVWLQLGCKDEAATAQKDESLSRNLLSGMDLMRALELCRGLTKLLEKVLHVFPQEDARLLCRWQGLTCDRMDQGHRYVDLVPDAFPWEDGFGYARDVCAECWN